MDRLLLHWPVDVLNDASGLGKKKSSFSFNPAPAPSSSIQAGDDEPDIIC